VILTRARRTGGAVPAGFVARPGQIRSLGPFVALGLPAILLTLAGVVFFLWPCEGSACVKTSLAAYLLVLLAAPTALVFGLPWILNPLTIGGAALTSLLMWLLLGRWSARRATTDVDGTWRTYAAELLFMIGGVWMGIILGLGVIGLWLSR
jgi:hypothetical protein